MSAQAKSPRKSEMEGSLARDNHGKEMVNQAFHAEAKAQKQRT
jgi:hypothetical protein